MENRSIDKKIVDIDIFNDKLHNFNKISLKTIKLANISRSLKTKPRFIKTKQLLIS